MQPYLHSLIRTEEAAREEKTSFPKEKETYRGTHLRRGGLGTISRWKCCGSKWIYEMYSYSYLFDVSNYEVIVYKCKFCSFVDIFYFDNIIFGWHLSVNKCVENTKKN